jgi:hypothetical protein
VASTVRSRRRVTAIAVPSALAVLMAGALAAAPAIAASRTDAPALPFPTVCPSGQTPAGTATGDTSASPSTSSTSPTPSASKSGTATPSTSPSTTSTPTPTPTTGTGTPTPVNGSKASSSPSTTTPSAGGTASPSPGTTSGDGFWGWLNGVWTWILSDAPYTAHTGAVQADAPLTRGGAQVEDGNFGLGAKQGSIFSDIADGDATPTPDCISSASAAALASKAAASGTSEGVTAGTVPWVMKTSDLSLYDLTYNGVKTVSVLDPDTGKYSDEQVLDFTSSKVTIASMVTYSIQHGQTVYNNAGSDTTTTLIDAHLMTVTLSGSLFGLVPQTYTPSNPPPLPVGLTVPLIPVVFTGVTTQLAFLNTGSISVPGFDGFAQDGVASPQ